MSSFLSSFSGKSSQASSKLSLDTPKTSEILTEPDSASSVKKKWEYTQEQLDKIEELKQYSATVALPESDPYYPWEQRFLADPGTHSRYMRAGKWKVDESKRRIKGTLEWRREFKPELIQASDVGVEAETGKIILTGFDLECRPIIYMRPGRENTERGDRQIRHLIYHLERAIDFMPPGQEQMCIICDYKSATSQTSPSLGVAKKVLNILQNHYVERLGRGIVVNMPWFINAFFTGLSPFLDPITRDKIRFNPKLSDLIPASQLDSEFPGGEYHFDYDYKVYWPTLIKFCHLAEDGTRVDSEGKPWVPPSGNGIKAAAEGVSAPEPVVKQSGTETAETAVPPSEPEAEAQELSSGLAGVSISAPETEVPAASTKPGAPAGEVVFDHPPSTAEKAEARASLEAARA